MSCIEVIKVTISPRDPNGYTPGIKVTCKRNGLVWELLLSRNMEVQISKILAESPLSYDNPSIDVDMRVSKLHGDNGPYIVSFCRRSISTTKVPSIPKASSET